MLDKTIMLPFAMFLIFLFAFSAVVGIIMFYHWTMAQNEAQFIATAMSKWGGYTYETEQTVKDFAQDIKLNRGDVDVSVNNIGPIRWGKPIKVEVEIPFKFKIGNYNFGTFNLKGMGRSVSSYLPGAYSVNYISP